MSLATINIARYGGRVGSTIAYAPCYIAQLTDIAWGPQVEIRARRLSDVARLLSTHMHRDFLDTEILTAFSRGDKYHAHSVPLRNCGLLNFKSALGVTSKK